MKKKTTKVKHTHTKRCTLSDTRIVGLLDGLITATSMVNITLHSLCKVKCVYMCTEHTLDCNSSVWFSGQWSEFSVRTFL